MQSFNRTRDSIEAFGRLQNKFIRNSNIFAKFQSQPCFPRKMVLCSLTRFCIIKPWINIPLLRGSNSSFWQTWKRIDRRLQYRENVFGKLQGLPRFYRKIFFLFVDQILHFWALYQYLISSKIGFRFLAKSKTGLIWGENGEKILGKFQVRSPFPRKMALYSLCMTL